MTSSSDSRRGRTEAYERMRVSEDRIRALRGQSLLMKQSLKSAKKSGGKAVSNESPLLKKGVRSPSKDQNQTPFTNSSDAGAYTGKFAGGDSNYAAPQMLQYSLLDSKQYT